MVNLKPNSVVFNFSGHQLSANVRAALELAVEQHLTQGKLEEVYLASVTTKTNIRAAFAKFVKGRVLRADREFGQEYVKAAFAAYEARNGHLTKELFDIVMAADGEGPYSYKRSYAINIRTGLGLFLIALHSSGAVTLPFTFTWPQMREDDGRRIEIGKHVSSELLSFVRTLNSQADTLPHPAFEAIGGDRKRREWFLSYATKLLLASGWHKPEDVNVTELLEIKATERVNSEKRHGIPLAYGALLDVLNLAYPGRISVSSQDWTEALKADFSHKVKVNGKREAVPKALFHLFGDKPRTDHDLMDEVLHLEALWGKPERVRQLTRLPGLDVDISALSKLWLDMEDLYITKVARESYRPFNKAVGWWNVYLFYYLPYWFDRNPGCSWRFPSTPTLLVKSVFVSRLLPIEEETPMTFIEYMNAQAERREWMGNSFYATLLQLQVFFEFVERYSEEIPGCEGFTQPLATYDFPRVSRPRNTNKQPVPRRFFGVYLDYHEALLAHQTVVLNKALSGEITKEGLLRLQANVNVIDTFATCDLVGFVPILFTRTKTVVLQFIPNVLDVRQVKLHGRKTILLPHPHALIQNLVALHTGIRHNHIQWLDREKFDALVNGDEADFPMLFVNTDKQKAKPWTPHVSLRVIELLRMQRQWCVAVANPAFNTEHYYNDNPRTKWPKFKPLFPYTGDGKPHGDDVYGDIWKAMLCGLQGLMPDLTEFGQGRLLRLLPPGLKPDDVDADTKRATYGASFNKMGDNCSLRVNTTSTPHSARVAVVSQYITFLPTDLIGKFITGQ